MARVQVEHSELGTEVHGDVVKAFYRHMKELKTPRGSQDVLLKARILEGIDAEDVEWDSDPWLLNCPNGTLDLQTGNLRAPSREDHITKQCPTRYNPNATAPRFLKFLDGVFQSNQDVIDYWQWVIGYALTGIVDHDCFFVMHGNGANGKSITNDTIAMALADYAMRTPTETLLVKRNEGIPNDVARLMGARFVYASEAEQGKRLAESLIKDMSG